MELHAFSFADEATQDPAMLSNAEGKKTKARAEIASNCAEDL